MVIGRDARISGPMVRDLVCASLNGMGIDVLDLGLSTTPTVEMVVDIEQADGGIIITASHNPGHWNALKLLNNKGEFINATDGAEVLQLAESGGLLYSEVGQLGHTKTLEGTLERHVEKILALDLVDVEAIRAKRFKVACDCVNSTGGLAVPMLLKALGVEEVLELYCEPNGEFPHNPEPLPENLTAISEAIKEHGADLGIVVDPDVDRLALVQEDGGMFGEEYTLVAVADHVLSHKPGNAVSNLSSTRALRTVTERHGGRHFASAVGEVNVVEQMKAENAVIGGEGNGGVILPELHYGRDALVGIALFLTHMAKTGKKVSEIRDSYPQLVISKNKIELTPETDVDGILQRLANKYANEEVSTVDGVKIDFANEWVHMRKSNTEPIIRIYAESANADEANALAERFMEEIRRI